MVFDRERAKRLGTEGWSERDIADALAVSRKRVRTIRRHADDGERSSHRIGNEVRRAKVESDVAIRRLDHLETYKEAKKKVRANKRLGLKARFDPSYEDPLRRQLKRWGSP